MSSTHPAPAIPAASVQSLLCCDVLLAATIARLLEDRGEELTEASAEALVHVAEYVIAADMRGGW